MTELTPGLDTALAALRIEATINPSAAGSAAARAALLAAADRRGATGTGRHHLRSLFIPRRLGLAVGGMAGIASVLLAAGWSAPAGSVLHPVRLAREHVAVLLPGLDRASLDLSFAEDRLADAATGGDRGRSLDEATALLADAATHLPADRHDRQWSRWQDDERALAVLRNGTPGSGAPAPVDLPERSTESSSSSEGSGEESGGSSTTTTRGEESTESGASSGESGDGSSTTTSSSGGGDGGGSGGSSGSDGGGGSSSASSTSSTTSSSSDH